MQEREQFIDLAAAKAAIAMRIAQMRVQIYGDDGSPEITRISKLPTQTWLNTSWASRSPATSYWNSWS